MVAGASAIVCLVRFSTGITNTPKGTIVPKQLNEMTALELMDARLRAIDAGDAERAQLIGHWLAARNAGYVTFKEGERLCRK